MTVIADFDHRLLMFLIVIGILTPIELTLTHEKHNLKGRLLGVLFWVVWTFFAIMAVDLFSRIGPSPLLRFGITPRWAAPYYDIFVAPVLAAILTDFYFYFYHRIQHSVPLLWRFHAVHHSIREMNAVNAYHHPFDEFINRALTVPVLWLITIDAPRAVAVMAIILALQPAYLHSPIKADLGWLRAIFGDNRFHRIHHSRDPKHYNTNFGAFTTLWDRLFGTAYWPAKDEWPEIGLDEIDQPRNFREWFDLPFRYQPSRIEARWRSEGRSVGIATDSGHL